MTSPDATLWASFLASDERASDQLFLVYFDSLYQYGLKLTNDEELTKDGIQNLFQQLWQRRGALGPVAALKPYLFAALRRQLARDQQAQRRQSQLAHIYETEFDVRYDPEDFDLTEEQLQRVLAALAQLSSRQREVVYLRFFDGLSYEHIASTLDINVQSTRNLVYQGLRALKQSIGLPMLIMLGEMLLAHKNNLLYVSIL